ncbi:helix-turn-helix domain-containing protein [Streptomyces sp. NBC_01511]|uniref:helix-turn-helix domain-containing protein n=1 Tax=Streptomyces sp. NBC_01511 TaxID=2903889 RepID=UPI00386D57F5
MTEALRGAARAELRDDLAKRYNAGASIRSLVPYAQGRSYGFVYRLLVEAKVVRRPRNPPRPTTK